jgi:RNase P protein component
MRELTRKVLPIYGKINFYYVLIAKISIFETPFLELEKELKKIIS